MKDTRLYLRHILEVIGRIEEDVAGGEEAFFARHLIQDAVLRNLQTAAESTKRIPDSLKSREPDVDWDAIVGFRNVLVHDYLGIDLELVWRLLQRDLPVLRDAVRRLLKEHDPLP